MKRRLSSLVALVLAVATACTAGSDGGEGAVAAGSVTTTSTSTTSTAPSTTTSIPTTTSTTTRPAPLSASSRLRIDGIGPVDVGMTVAEARAAAGTGLSVTKEPYCDVLTSPGGPAGVSLIVTTPASGRIELIIVTEPSVATVSGIRVGSTEPQVVRTYPGRLRSVNPSLPVHRLVYTAADTALSDRALVFVVDNGRVATMYSGRRDHVEADEICG
jgi:hypothetical protein